MTIAPDLNIFNLFYQVCIIYPQGVFAWQRKRHRPLPPVKAQIDSPEEPIPLKHSGIMISDKVYKLCTSKESVSALLAKDPTLAPGDAWKQLYGGHSAGEKESTSTAKAHRDHITPDDLRRARECGNWGPTEPSELFLRVGIFTLPIDLY